MFFFSKFKSNNSERNIEFRINNNKTLLLISIFYWWLNNLTCELHLAQDEFD